MLTSVEVTPGDSVGRPSTALTTGGCGAGAGAGAGLQQVQILLSFSQRILYHGTSFSFLVFSSLVPEEEHTESHLLTSSPTLNINLHSHRRTGTIQPRGAVSFLPEKIT